MANAAPLGLRLLLEGIEIPVIAATVHIQPDTPSAASIQIIATNMAFQLLPRTMVHLFFLDKVAEFDAENLDNTSTRPTITYTQQSLNRFEAQDSAYRLLFCGEVVGFTYSKTPSTRQMVLQCLDLSSHWDSCYQFFSDYSVNGNGLTDKSHVFVGAGAGLFDNVAGGTQWMLGRILSTKPTTPEFRDAKGLYGGILHLFEAVGGIRYRNGQAQGYHGVNDYFSIAELRYNLMGQIGAITADDTSVKLYQAKAFLDWLRYGMTSLGTLMSFRDIVNHVNRYIFHNVYPNPCAHYVPESTETYSRLVNQTTLADTTAGKGVLALLRKLIDQVGAAREHFIQAVPLAIGVSSAEFNAGVDGSKEAQKTIVLIETQLRARPSDDSAAILVKVKSVGAALQQTSGEVDENIRQYQVNSDTAIKARKNVGLLDTAMDTIGDLLGMKGRKRTKKQVRLTDSARLYTQIFVPETFFAAPPRCNVIFPDQYFELSFSRNFMREITRLSCQGGMGVIIGESKASAELFGRHYFAPNIKDARNQNLRATLARGSRVILPHEINAGIVPKFEWVTDGHRWGVQAARNKGESDSIHQSGKVGYIQRLAHFQFFLHRWSSRQMNVTGRFNPYLVLGFPAVVIDRAAPPAEVASAISSQLGQPFLPTQFIGKVESIVHSLNQHTGMTTASLSYCRTHRAVDDEFLGVLSREVPEYSEEGALYAESFRPAEFVNPAAGGALRAAFQLIMRRYATKTLKVNDFIQKAGKIKKIEIEDTIFLTEREAAAAGLDDSQINETRSDQGRTERGITFPSRFTISFSRPVVKSFRARASIDDALRPGWYSPNIWSNEKVGEAVYKPLLGTKAITDDTALNTGSIKQMIQQLGVEYDAAIAEGLQGESNSYTFKTPGGLTAYAVQGGTIEEAVDGLVAIYSLIKKNGGNLTEFVRQYVERPIANLEQVLGSQNLEFNSMGEVADPTTMKEGFHSRAFGKYNADLKLPDKVGSEIRAGADALHVLMPGVAQGTPILRLSLIDKSGKPTAIDPAVDPRGRSYARVYAYRAELKLSKGLLSS
jgi:hypothetical protein